MRERRVTVAERSDTMRSRMRRVRLIATFLSAFVLLLATAPVALAGNGGEGWYGETNDVVITNTMFLVIIFFPTIILLFSLIQWRLEKRKHARLEAKKRSSANADPRGGW
jgi:fatty acid desaturase